MSFEHEKSFEDLHPTGIKGIFKVYGSLSFIRRPAFLLSFGLTVVLSAILAVLNPDNDFIVIGIEKILEVGMTIISSLIGLSLAGLVLIVSFGNLNLLKSLVKESIQKAIIEKKNIKYSSYQTLIAKFSYAVFVQVVTLITLVIVHFIRVLDISLHQIKIAYILNYFTITAIVFGILYSLLLLGHMVINIFTIAQMNHMVIFTEVIDELPEDDKKTKE